MAKKKTTAKKTGPKGPTHRSCACMSVHLRLCDEHPEMREMEMKMEMFTGRFQLMGMGSRMAAAKTGPVKIPVVVHVVYNQTPENLSEAQVKSQITALNKDFRLKNTDKSKIPAPFKHLAADAGIEFTLADITRTKTSTTSFGSDDAVKFTKRGGIDAWPTDQYLNLWTCRLSGGLLGYAQFPVSGPADTDGVVILNTAFGTTGTAQAPFNKGRTATHEIGHWLNLRHIWGDVNGCGGTDFVDDTPNAQMPNYGSPSFPHVTCNNGPNGDLFTDYMDYVDDAAMFMFTQGQVERMQAALAGPRSSFLNTKAKAAMSFT